MWVFHQLQPCGRFCASATCQVSETLRLQPRAKLIQGRPNFSRAPGFPASATRH